MRELEGVKKLDRLLVKWRGRANPGGGVSESTRCNAGTDETFSRRICAEMFRLSPYCPERPIRTASLRSHHSGLSRIGADAAAFPIFHT